MAYFLNSSRLMRTPPVLILLFASGCAFPLSGVTSANVVWERSHEGSVTVSAVLRAEGQCPTLGADAHGTLNGVPLTFTNARHNVLEGCSAAAFSASVDEAFDGESGDGIFVISDGETELRLVVADLFADRGLRRVNETATISPGETIALRWFPEADRQTFGLAGLVREGTTIAYATGSPGEPPLLDVPQSLSPGPIIFFTQGTASLSVTECPATVTCAGTASTLGDSVALEVEP